MGPWGAFVVGVIVGGFAIWFWGDELRVKIDGPTSGVSAPKTATNALGQAEGESGNLFIVSDVVVDQGHGAWLFGMMGQVSYCFRPDDPSSGPECTPASPAAGMMLLDTSQGEDELE